MRHKFPVLTVKTLLKSVYIYGSYRKNKIGYRFLDHPVDRKVMLRLENDNMGQENVNKKGRANNVHVG